METFSSLDFQLQNEIVQKVIDLSWGGLGYKRIIKKIKEEFSVNLGLGLLSYWFNNEVCLYGGQNHFDSKPTKELAYVLGVMFGDGSIFYDKKKQGYIVGLSAIDRDFVEHFSRCISKVLNKEKRYSVVKFRQKAMDSCMYSARARSKELYYFIKELKEDFEKVKPFAEAYPKEFIQGLADSEGCPRVAANGVFQVGVCVASSMGVSLLAFVSFLLKMKFGIKSRVYHSKNKGATDSCINGRLITRQNDLFVLNISNFNSTKLFSTKINFNIGRKKDKLNYAVLIFEKNLPMDRIASWCKKYSKINKKWISQKPNQSSTIDVLTPSPGIEPESHP